VNAANWVKMQSDEGEINPVDILRWPGVMAARSRIWTRLPPKFCQPLMARWMTLSLPAKRRPGAESLD
jgi:hypothetical protein